MALVLSACSASTAARKAFAPDTTINLQGTKLSIPGFPVTFFLTAQGKLTQIRGFAYSYDQFVTLAQQRLGVSL